MDSRKELEVELDEAYEKLRIQELTLRSAADKLADLGVINNTPYAKYLFIQGERAL